MSLPLTNYLQLETNGNAATKQVLDGLISKHKKHQFVSISVKILKIEKSEADELYSTLNILNTIPEEQTSTIEADCTERIEEKEISPTVSTSEDSNIFEIVKQKDEIMKQTNKSEVFKQHPVLKQICNVNQEDVEEDNIAIIKEMQYQYSSERLDKIPKQIFEHELDVRANMLAANDHVKQLFTGVNSSMNNEINKSLLLKKMIKQNIKDNHVTRNKRTLCESLLNITNEATKLQDLIDTSRKQVEEYAIQRNLIERVNNMLYPKMNSKYKKIVDANVTNFFLSHINSLSDYSAKLSSLFNSFELHIEQRSYTKHIGSIDNMKQILKDKAKKLAHDQLLYRLRTNIKIIFDTEFDTKYLNGLLKKYKHNLLKIVQQIVKEKNLKVSEKVLEENKICINFVNNVSCHNECEPDMHKLPEKIRKCRKRKASPEKIETDTNNDKTKRKKMRKMKGKSKYMPTKQSKQFENFFNKNNTNKKRRTSFGMSKLSLI